ncbi:MAG: signal peptidase I [Bacteroidota bacterium]|jgi:signal peptidase I
MNELPITEAAPVQHVGKSSLRVRDYVQVLVVTVLVALFLKTFVIAAYRIPSASMENTLRPGDFLLVNKFIYGAQTPRSLPFSRIEVPQIRLPALRTPRRGDLIVFELPPYARYQIDNAASDTYVKRCIALPGDTLSIVNRNVFVNGEELASPQFGRTSKRRLYPQGFGDSRIFPKGSTFNEDNYGPLAIPKQGDKVKLDAKSFLGLKDLIEHEGHSAKLNPEGNVLVDGVKADVYEVKQNYYFMMGDNRDNSLDSRFWGFVPEDLIIGKVMVIYWSVDETGGSFFSNIRWGRIGSILN